MADVLFLLHCARMRILRKLSTYTIPACHYITERLKWILNADDYNLHLCRTIKCKRLEIGVIRPFLHLRFTSSICDEQLVVKSRIGELYPWWCPHALTGVTKEETHCVKRHLRSSSSCCRLKA